jgi:Ca2+-binding RTX toxin-like protein
MALSGTPQFTVAIDSFDTKVTFDGNTFDANQLGYATAVVVDGTTFLYYAGLAYNNRKELGLATSTDGENFFRFSNDPIVSASEEPWFASFRILPSTVLYEDGVFKMWFHGINSNLTSDSGQTTGWGYATSTDGMNWTFLPDPIRSESGSSNGDQLIEVVKVGDTYMAYYRDMNGPLESSSRYYVAYSTDGINFTGDTEFDAPGGASMVAASSVDGVVISIWYDPADQSYFTAYSTDGVDFVAHGDLDLPPNVWPEDILISGDTITVYCTEWEGPGSWGWGTSSLGSFTTTLDTFVDPSIFLDDPVTFVGGEGDDLVTGGNNEDEISGGAGKDTLDGAAGDDSLAGGDGKDHVLGGLGNDAVSGGNGADRLAGGAGDDTLTGGRGPDTFVFEASEVAGDLDVITDLEKADRIELRGFGDLDASDLDLEQVGADVLVTIQAGDGEISQILILNQQVQNLGADVFAFY